MSFFIILKIQYNSYQYMLTRYLFQSVNTSDSTSFKQRRKGEAERSEIEQKHKKAGNRKSWQGHRQLSTKHREKVYKV